MGSVFTDPLYETNTVLCQTYTVLILGFGVLFKHMNNLNAKPFDEVS